MLNIRVTAGHRPTQAQEEPGHLSRFCLELPKFFSKIESKFLNSMVLAGGFAMECAKKVLILSIYKKGAEKSAV